MKKPLLVSLKRGERIYVNGAIIGVDRKVSLELLNDVAFLLQHHVLAVEEATTPLRKLYFAVQALVLNPASSTAARTSSEQLLGELARSIGSGPLHAGLGEVSGLIERGRCYEALRAIRRLYPLELDEASDTVSEQRRTDADPCSAQ